MEIFEAKMIAREYGIRGTITMFDGLRFDEDNPFTHASARRAIRLLGDELQKRPDLHSIGVDPAGKRRDAITWNSEWGVWDTLPLLGARGAVHTSRPHCTLALRPRLACASITLPHAMKGGFRTRLRASGEKPLLECLRTIAARIQPVLSRSDNSKCSVYITQRHYRSQRSTPEVDARLEVNLRTLVPGKRKEAKYQPEWATAIHQVLSNKRSNIQLGIETNLSYDCAKVRSQQVIDLFAESWIAMFPIVDFGLGHTARSP